MEVYSKTVGGEVHQSFFVGKTWTDKEGKFFIPPKEIKKPSFPASFGNKVGSLNVAARAVTSKGYKSEGKGIKDTKENLEILLNLKPPKDEEHYFSAIQGLYSFISNGRIGDSLPAVSEIERKEVLGLAINAREYYLRIYSDPKNSDERSHYSSALQHLGYLYKMEGNFEKAINTFIKAKDFDLNRGVKLWLNEYENQIKEIQRLKDYHKNRKG